MKEVGRRALPELPQRRGERSRVVASALFNHLCVVGEVSKERQRQPRGEERFEAFLLEATCERLVRRASRRTELWLFDPRRCTDQGQRPYDVRGAQRGAET